MLGRFLACSVAAAASLFAGAASADPDVPLDARPLVQGEIEIQLDGRSFQFEIYGEDKPLSGTSTWDLARGVVYGTYLWNNSHRGKWRRAWFVDGDRNCIKPILREAECRRLYRDGKRFFQLGENGGVYAVLTPLE